MQGSQEIISECIDILTEVLVKFGRSLKDEHLFLKDILLQYLAEPRSVIRKKAVSCTGELLNKHLPASSAAVSLMCLLDHDDS